MLDDLDMNTVDPHNLLANDPVPIAVPHVPVRGVRPGDGCDPMPPRLLARDPAVAVVIVAGESPGPPRIARNRAPRSQPRCRSASSR